VTTDRLTIGIVTPHAAAGPEVELPAMTRGHIAAVVSRTGPATEASQTSSTAPAQAQLRASTERAAIDRAALTFSDTPLDAVVHASTTSGYVIGPREESLLVERLSRRFGVPAVASCAAAATALQTHGVGLVQLVHPPWFDDEFDELGAAYFRSQGIDVVVTKAVGLPDEPAEVSTQRVIDWVEQHVDDRAEAVFLAGNGFRASGAVEELEQRTSRLVLEANQVLLWRIQAATGARWDITGYGRLLRSKTWRT
jgi:maleate isomerase